MATLAQLLAETQQQGPTRGKWWFDEQSGVVMCDHGQLARPVAYIAGGRAGAIPNGHIIAAALDMRDAIAALLSEFDDTYDGPEHPLNRIVREVQRLQAALERATPKESAP